MDITYFVTICSSKKFQANLEVLITYVTNRGKARVTLHIGPGHGNNCQIILKLFGYHTFSNSPQHKKLQANLEVSEVLITHVTNGGKAMVMLHTGAGHIAITMQYFQILSWSGETFLLSPFQFLPITIIRLIEDAPFLGLTSDTSKEM